MSQPYLSREAMLGEVMLFAGHFIPAGWAPCNGQLLHIEDNATLHAVIGHRYGGDGRTTFALPDLRGAAPAHAPSGAGRGRMPVHPPPMTWCICVQGLFPPRPAPFA